MLYNEKEKKQELNSLIVEKMKLDKFFTMYLDKFGSKMDSEKPNTPIWHLYKKKYKEYEEIDYKINVLKYQLSLK